MPTSSICHDFSIKTKSDAKKFVKALDLALKAKEDSVASAPSCSFRVCKGDDVKTFFKSN